MTGWLQGFGPVVAHRDGKYVAEKTQTHSPHGKKVKKKVERAGTIPFECPPQ